MKKYFWSDNNVNLRIINKNDVDLVYKSMLDTKFIINKEHGVPLPPIYENVENLINNAVKSSKEEEEIWFAIENELNIMVGYGIISCIDSRLGNCQCNIYIFNEYRKKGYGTSCYKIMLDYIFNERRLHKVNCCTVEGNNESPKFLFDLGFKLECARTDMFYTHGKYLTEYYFGLIKDEYREQIKTNIKNDELIEDFMSNVPYSNLGELSSNTKINPKKKCTNISYYDRNYFWSYDGITIRGITLDDYLLNSEILYDSQICRYYDNDVKLPMIIENVEEFSDENIGFKNKDRLEFAITNEENKYIGNIALCSPDSKNGKFSLSIYLLSKYRGMGYGTKALRLIVSYAFFELRMNKLLAVVNDGNIASATMMRKIGCKVEGVQRENAFYEGRYVDEIFFGVNKQEFIEANKCFNVIP